MGGRPTWEIIASLWLHFIVAVVLVLFERCAPSVSEPLFKPNEVMRVQIAAAPKAKSPRTQRAERAPEPPPSSAPPPPAPEPVAATPPPPTPSSDMVLRQDREPEPAKAKTEPAKAKTEPAKAKSEPSKAKATSTTPPNETPRDNTDARAALLAAQREPTNPNAPLGTVNRPEAGPDGVEGASANPIGIGEADPILAAYILACRDAILPNWTPLPSTVAEHPDYAVVVQVPVAADGTMDTSKAKIVKGSGDSSFDRTALMALAKTRRLPPPPDVWQASAAKGVQFRLSAKDK